MNEIWRDIKDYEGLYQVSNLGRVRSVDRYCVGKGNCKRFCKGKILKPATHTNGYLIVNLCKNIKTKSYLVHRLVAEAFKPNLHNYPTVDHINRNKTDNRLENLRWAPYELQVKNSNRESLIKSIVKPVKQYTVDGQFIKEYTSITEASIETGLKIGNICKCCYYKRKSTGGYIWKFSSDSNLVT